MRLVLAALLVLLAQPALAESPGYAAAARLPDAALAEIRGGFMVRGFDIRFGLTVESRVDGAPLLASTLAGAPTAEGRTLEAGDLASTHAFHFLRDGHLTILSNRVDGRTLEQVVTLNIDVLNFRAVTGFGSPQSTLRLAESMRAVALGALPR